MIAAIRQNESKISLKHICRARYLNILVLIFFFFIATLVSRGLLTSSVNILKCRLKRLYFSYISNFYLVAKDSGFTISFFFSTSLKNNISLNKYSLFNSLQTRKNSPRLRKKKLTRRRNLPFQSYDVNTLLLRNFA